MRGRRGRDQAARGSTPTHRHLLTRVIITDYWANTNQVLLQMKCIILLLLETRSTRPTDAKLLKMLGLWIMFDIIVITKHLHI